MAYKDLTHFIQILEQNNELVRIKEYINPNLEITEITDRISKMAKGGKALLFENTGTKFPVLINALGSERRMELALGVSTLDELGLQIESLLKKFTSPKNSLIEKLKMLPALNEISSWMPTIISGRGKCQEVIHSNPDLSILPVLTCWPFDGGPFITFPMVNTKDPITGIRNIGMYRMQILDNQSTGMHWHKHKVGARHFNEYKQLGKLMPVAVALGGDPAYTYSATAPMPDNIDEYMLAGFLRKKKVELIKCITQDIEVPSDADIIIEGYINPQEELIWEGPFGDHTGYYSLADWYPKFHVTCITHKKNAIYPATIVGIPPQEDAYIAKATERLFLAPIKLTLLPEIADMDIPIAGVAHNLTLISIHKTYSGQAIKAAYALWGAGQMMFNKNLIVVDANVDVHDYLQVAQAISEHVSPATDIYFSQGPLDVLDHSASKFAFGGKMCIDATKKHNEELSTFTDDFEKNQFDQELIVKEISGVIGVFKINTSLLNKGVSGILIAINKFGEKNLHQICEELSVILIKHGIKFALLTDQMVDINDMLLSLWVIANNIDPKRDHYLYTHQEKSTILMDGTRKTYKENQFKRDWPNIVSMNSETIQKIDLKWNDMFTQELISSPSLKYKILTSNEGAIYEQ